MSLKFNIQLILQKDRRILKTILEIYHTDKSYRNNKETPKSNTVEDKDIVNNTQASIIESTQPMIIPIRDLVQSAKRTRTSTTGTGTDESENEETMRIAKNQINLS